MILCDCDCCQSHSYCHIVIIIFRSIEALQNRSFPSINGLVAILNTELSFNAFYTFILSPIASDEKEWDTPMLNMESYNPMMTCMQVPMHAHIALYVHWLIY